MKDEALIPDVDAASSAPLPSAPVSAVDDAEAVGAGETDEVLDGVPSVGMAVTALVKGGVASDVAAEYAGRPVVPVGVLVAEPLGLRTLSFVSTYI